MSDVQKMWSGLCLPVKVYVILTLLMVVLQFTTIVREPAMTMVSIVVGLILAGLIAWLMQVLCNGGHEWAAWVLLFLPLILMAAMFVILVIVTGIVVTTAT